MTSNSSFTDRLKCVAWWGFGYNRLKAVREFMAWIVKLTNCEWDSKAMSDDFNQGEVFKVALFIGGIVFVPAILGLILLIL